MSISSTIKDVEALGIGAGPMTIVGRMVVGGVLKATYNPGYTSSGLQWYRRAGVTITDIAGQTTDSYTLVAADRPYDEIGCRAIGVSYNASGGKILPAVPAAPQIATIIAGDATVSVTVTRANDDGGSAVTTDRVYLYDSATGSEIAHQDGAGTIQFLNLQNGVAVKARASSINSSGESPLSEFSAVVTPNRATMSRVVNGYPVNSATL